MEHKYEIFQNKMFDYFDLRLKEKINGKVVVTYSAYKNDTKGVPINNLDEVAFQGSLKFYREWDPELLKSLKIKNSQPYESKKISNPTWIDICKLANDMLKKTKNNHHVFLEDIFVKKGFSGNKGYFVMGS